MNELSPTDHAGPVNPAGLGWRLARDYLSWRMRHPIASATSHSKLRALYGSERGNAAVVLCNGPSLRSVDFAALRGVKLIGLNKINLLLEEIPGLKIDYLVAVNDLVVKQNCDFLNRTAIPTFVSSRSIGVLQARPGLHWLYASPVDNFATQVFPSMYEGATVTYAALQLAYHLGFSRVALVGCDHNFAVKGTPNLAVKAEGADNSHFHPNYFAHGQTWQLPDLVESERAYMLAHKVYSAAGRELYNCTAGGKLEIFPRLPLQDFLNTATPLNRPTMLSSQ
ncbi:hypothetical protein LZ009_04450 [Ramlibacter sp. XY19]|uniref:hypothetical protein n=1 Tax=Ramlibacter paludis TaxID=2908000 RepID=UPI0023DCD5C8|nr:hypothetical protein [Ramlibacter paludis]MCG2592026.1 hypothetical protein [Ramlibacter paludis]